MADLRWIKITLSMFDNDKIKLIDAMPERDTIFNIWIKLLVQAGKCNAGGFIFLNENIPYTEEMLATIFNRPINSIRLALQTLKSFGMVDIQENNLIKIANWDKHQNVEGMEKIREQNRLRKQKQRDKQKQLKAPDNEEVTGEKDDIHCDNAGQSRDSHAIEEELEEDIEEELDIENKKEDEEIEESSSSAALIDKGFADVIKAFNNNIHSVTPIEAQRLEDWLNVFDATVVIKAIEESVTYNKRSYGYIKAVLENWQNNNLKTIQDVEAFLRDRDDKKNRLQARNPKNTFANYGGQREYDIDELEKQLLGRE